MLASAIHLDAIGDAPGAAGLAFQAADLAMKALTIAIDGSDAGSHHARMQRARELLEADPAALRLLWETRQRDFYGDASAGDEMRLPSEEQVREALSVAARLIDRIGATIADANETSGPAHGGQPP